MNVLLGAGGPPAVRLAGVSPKLCLNGPTQWPKRSASFDHFAIACRDGFCGMTEENPRNASENRPGLRGEARTRASLRGAGLLRTLRGFWRVYLKPSPNLSPDSPPSETAAP